MKKIGWAILLLIGMAVVLTCCVPKKEIPELSKTLGIDLSVGTVVQSEDTHGARGDGMRYVKISLPKDNEKVLEAIKQSDQWSPLPLTENLNTFVYGKETEDTQTGPYATRDNADQSVFPPIKNGYYFFYDRQKDKDNPKDDRVLFEGSSFNCTIAIYDRDEKMLHYYESDS